MSLYLYVLAFGSHLGRGQGPISIKHGPFGILIYDTPTIFLISSNSRYINVSSMNFN